MNRKNLLCLLAVSFLVEQPCADNEMHVDSKTNPRSEYFNILHKSLINHFTNEKSAMREKNNFFYDIKDDQALLFFYNMDSNKNNFHKKPNDFNTKDVVVFKNSSVLKFRNFIEKSKNHNGDVNINTNELFDFCQSNDVNHFNQDIFITSYLAAIARNNKVVKNNANALIYSIITADANKQVSIVGMEPVKEISPEDVSDILNVKDFDEEFLNKLHNSQNCDLGTAFYMFVKSAINDLKEKIESPNYSTDFIKYLTESIFYVQGKKTDKQNNFENQTNEVVIEFDIEEQFDRKSQLLKELEVAEREVINAQLKALKAKAEHEAKVEELRKSLEEKDAVLQAQIAELESENLSNKSMQRNSLLELENAEREIINSKFELEAQIANLEYEKLNNEFMQTNALFEYEAKFNSITEENTRTKSQLKVEHEAKIEELRKSLEEKVALQAQIANLESEKLSNESMQRNALLELENAEREIINSKFELEAQIANLESENLSNKSMQRNFEMQTNALFEFEAKFNLITEENTRTKSQLKVEHEAKVEELRKSLEEKVALQAQIEKLESENLSNKSMQRNSLLELEVAKREVINAQLKISEANAIKESQLMQAKAEHEAKVEELRKSLEEKDAVLQAQIENLEYEKLVMLSEYNLRERNLLEEFETERREVINAQLNDFLEFGARFNAMSENNDRKELQLSQAKAIISIGIKRGKKLYSSFQLQKRFVENLKSQLKTEIENNNKPYNTTDIFKEKLSAMCGQANVESLLTYIENNQQLQCQLNETFNNFDANLSKIINNINVGRYFAVIKCFEYICDNLRLAQQNSTEKKKSLMLPKILTLNSEVSGDSVNANNPVYANSQHEIDITLAMKLASKCNKDLFKRMQHAQNHGTYYDIVNIIKNSDLKFQQIYKESSPTLNIEGTPASQVLDRSGTHFSLSIEEKEDVVAKINGIIKILLVREEDNKILKSGYDNLIKNVKNAKRVSAESSELENRQSIELSELENRQSIELSELENRQSIELSELEKRKSIELSELEKRKSIELSELEETKTLEKKAPSHPKIVSKVTTKAPTSRRDEKKRKKLERIESERIESERIESERIESERIESERIEFEEFEERKEIINSWNKEITIVAGDMAISDFSIIKNNMEKLINEERIRRLTIEDEFENENSIKIMKSKTEEIKASDARKILSQLEDPSSPSFEVDSQSEISEDYEKSFEEICKEAKEEQMQILKKDGHFIIKNNDLEANHSMRKGYMKSILAGTKMLMSKSFDRTLKGELESEITNIEKFIKHFEWSLYCSSDKYFEEYCDCLYDLVVIREKAKRALCIEKRSSKNDSGVFLSRTKSFNEIKRTGKCEQTGYNRATESSKSKSRVKQSNSTAPTNQGKRKRENTANKATKTESSNRSRAGSAAAPTGVSTNSAVATSKNKNGNERAANARSSSVLSVKSFINLDGLDQAKGADVEECSLMSESIANQQNNIGVKPGSFLSSSKMNSLLDKTKIESKIKKQDRKEQEEQIRKNNKEEKEKREKEIEENRKLQLAEARNKVEKAKRSHSANVFRSNSTAPTNQGERKRANTLDQANKAPKEIEAARVAFRVKKDLEKSESSNNEAVPRAGSDVKAQSRSKNEPAVVPSRSRAGSAALTTPKALKPRAVFRPKDGPDAIPMPVRPRPADKVNIPHRDITDAQITSKYINTK